MFDVAYQVELSICIAQIERDKIWNRILSAPSIRSSMVECINLGYWRSMIDYAEMLYGTHGV